MTSLEYLNTADNEQAFIDEVMSKKPLFKTTKDAFDFYSSKLELIAKDLGLTTKELIVKADSSGSPTQLEELALELSLRICALKRSLPITNIQNL